MKTKKIKMQVIKFTKLKDIVRINQELEAKAIKGELIGISQSGEALELAEPKINGIWRIELKENGCIKRIILF